MKKELLMQILNAEKENKKLDMDLYHYLVSLTKEEEDLLKYALSLVRTKDISSFLKMMRECREIDRAALYQFIGKLRSLNEVGEQAKKKLFSSPVIDAGSATLIKLLNGFFHAPEESYIRLFTNKNLLNKKNKSVWSKLHKILFGSSISPFVIKLFTNEHLLKYDDYTSSLVNIFQENKTNDAILFDGLAERITSESLFEKEENFDTFLKAFTTSYQVLKENEKGNNPRYKVEKEKLFKSFIYLSQAHELLKDASSFKKACEVLETTFKTNAASFDTFPAYNDLLAVLLNPLYYKDEALYQTLCNRLTFGIKNGYIERTNLLLKILDFSMPLSKTEATTIIQKYDFSMKDEKSVAFYKVATNNTLRLDEERWSKGIDTILSINEQNPNLLTIADLIIDEDLQEKPTLQSYVLEEVKKLGNVSVTNALSVITNKTLLEDVKRYKKALSLILKVIPEKNEKDIYLSNLLTKESFLSEPKAYDYFLNKASYIIDKDTAFPYIFATDCDVIRKNSAIWKETLEKIASCTEQGMGTYYSVYRALNEKTALVDYIQERELPPKDLLNYLSSCEEEEITEDTMLDGKKMCKVLTERKVRKGK